MEQAMRNIERTRAIRIGSLRDIQRTKPGRGLSDYFAVRPNKPVTKPARRRSKSTAH